MKSSWKVPLAVAGAMGIAGAFLWWFADHRRGMAWAVTAIRKRFPDVAHIPVADLALWLRDPVQTTPLLVDARTAEEFNVSHLPGARRIDPNGVDVSVRGLSDFSRPVVVYCSAGYRGAVLARRLQIAGHRQVWNLDGGIFAWANADHPLERAGVPARQVHPFHRLFARLLKPGIGG